MADRTKLRNLWLVLAYGLATLTVQDHHHDGARVDGPKAVHLAGCSDPSPHYAGHGAPEVLRTDPHCPACQFRSEHHAGAERPEPVSIAPSRLLGSVDVPFLLLSATSRPSARAPPRA